MLSCLVEEANGGAGEGGYASEGWAHGGCSGAQLQYGAQECPTHCGNGGGGGDGGEEPDQLEVLGRRDGISGVQARASRDGGRIGELALGVRELLELEMLPARAGKIRRSEGNGCGRPTE